MDFCAIGRKVFELHLKYATALLAHSNFDYVVVHTTQKINGTTTVTHISADGIPPVLRSIRANSTDLDEEVEFFLSGSLEGIDPQAVHDEIRKVDGYSGRVCIIGNTVYIA